MESAYRAWLRERRERSNPEELNELCRELQTALGTAKWQVCQYTFFFFNFYFAPKRLKFTYCR